MEQPALERSDAEHVSLSETFSLNSRLLSGADDQEQGAWSQSLNQLRVRKGRMDAWWQQTRMTEKSLAPTESSECELMWEVEDLRRRRGSLNDWWNGGTSNSSCPPARFESWQVSSLGSETSASGLDDSSDEGGSGAASSSQAHAPPESDASLLERQRDEEHGPMEGERRPMDVLRSKLFQSNPASPAESGEQPKESSQGLFEELIDVFFDRVLQLYCCQRGGRSQESCPC